MNVAFRRFKGTDLLEQVHIFGLSNIHTYGSNTSLIRLFSLIFNYAKPRMLKQYISMQRRIYDDHNTVQVFFFL